MNYQNHQAFTLIELMIAIAIVAIIAAIALPAYLDYTTRAKVSEGLIVLDGAKLRLEEIFYLDGWIDSNKLNDSSIQTQNLGKYVDQVSWQIDNTTISTLYVRYNNNIAPVVNKCLGLIATLGDLSTGVNLATTSVSNMGRDKITWLCKSSSGNASIPYKYLPTNCRNNPDIAPTLVTNAGLTCG